MASMTHRERMAAVVAGRRADHPPVSFWHHFPPPEAHGPAAVRAHLRLLAWYNLDFLKVMNDHPYPWPTDLRTPADLRGLPVRRGDEGGFGGQIAVLRELSAELGGRVPLITTLFNTWTVLRRLMQSAASNRHGPPKLFNFTSDADRAISALLAEDRPAVAAALDAIGTSLANFSKRCIEAGAEGVFLSVRDDWVDTEENGLHSYDELVREQDLKILKAAAGAPYNLLHVCGVPRNFAAFAAYPVAILNWADRAAGPSIGEVIGQVRPTVCGGVDNLRTLPEGTPDDVANEVRDALRQAGARPIIVSAGCTFDPNAVSEKNLRALVEAARSERSLAS